MRKNLRLSLLKSNGTKKVSREKYRSDNIFAKSQDYHWRRLGGDSHLERKFDFEFIDAEKKQYFQYLKLAEDNRQKGAVVFAINAGVFAEQRGNYLELCSQLGQLL